MTIDKAPVHGVDLDCIQVLFGVRERDDAFRQRIDERPASCSGLSCFVTSRQKCCDSTKHQNIPFHIRPHVVLCGRQRPTVFAHIYQAISMILQLASAQSGM